MLVGKMVKTFGRVGKVVFKRRISFLSRVGYSTLYQRRKTFRPIGIWGYSHCCSRRVTLNFSFRTPQEGIKEVLI